MKNLIAQLPPVRPTGSTLHPPFTASGYIDVISTSYRPTRVTDSLSSVRSDKPEGVKSIAEIPCDFTRSGVIVNPPSLFLDKPVLRRWEC